MASSLTVFRTRIKICGITRAADALAAADAGADAIGFVFHRASPRFVEPEAAGAIRGHLPPFVTVVGLFVDAAPAFVLETMRAARIDTLQFHGDESSEYCAQFGLPYLKAIRVRQGVDLLQSEGRFPTASALLLDAYRAGIPGGTGERFDWDLVPRTLARRIVLSGGLNPGNVGDGIRQLRPWAVDVSTGVEAAKGIKDAALITAFADAVRRVDEEAGEAR
jgi:phosphoribosylanthranilate isomerase